MKKMLCTLLAAFCLSSAAVAEDYQNPMKIEGQHAPIQAGASDYGIGDPFVLRHNGVYYLYPSSCEERVRVYTSRDLVHWEYQGYCTENRDVYFAYAPEVIYWRGDFYMITSPGGNGHYILKSDSPLGIFRPVTGNFGYSIDGSFFKLDDGRLIMLNLHDNIIKEILLDEHMLPSGVRISTGANLKGWTEGPGLFRRGEWYYLTFTGNHVCSTGYQVAYASRRGSPMGAFYQPDDATLLIHSVMGDEFKGLGHSSNVIGPDMDSVYTAYHSLVNLTGPARLYNLDRLLTNGGTLYTTGATNFPMPVPAMPDAYGDMQGDMGAFEETPDGYFAVIDEAALFTEECNFVLNGGIAQWLLGEATGREAILTTEGKRLRLTIGDETAADAALPELGREGRLHTLRVECTPDVLYAYVDGMRVITLEKPGLTARRVGAIKADGVSYSFLGVTGEALGSSDYAAVKTVPGVFHAIHALNAGAFSTASVGRNGEKAAVLGSADYAVRVGADGNYAFDLTVLRTDAGKAIDISVDGEKRWSGQIPLYDGQDVDELATFTTAPIPLTAGAHTLSFSGDGATVSRVSSFKTAETQPLEIDFTTNSLRDRFYTLGNFIMRPSEGTLSISPNKRGFAVFGNEGCTDMTLRVRFELPKDGIGTSGIFFRATNISLYEHQVKESFFGYALSVNRLGVNLRRMRYGAVGRMQFASVPEWQEAETGEVTIKLSGGRVLVYVPGHEEPILDIHDAQPFTHGLYGFFSTGKELTVLDVEAKAD